MQAIILAAGKSTRTFPLTLTRPKPMLKVLDKTILEHNLDALKGIVEEAIIVVGYMADMIKNKLGSIYNGIKITYVEQKKQSGTYDAVKCAEELVNDKIIILGGDDLFSKDDIKACIKHKYSILASEVKNPEKFGVLEIQDNYLTGIEEKPAKPKSNFANTALYVLDKGIFKINVKKSKRGEFEFTDAVTEFAKTNKVYVEKVKDYWLPIGYPWSYLEANVFMIKRMKKSEIKGTIEQGVSIKGNIFLGEGSVIKGFSYIEGPVYIGKNCEIGPYCHIRPDTIIMDNCRIGKTELFDVVIMDNTTSKHFGYLAHGVIGEKVNIGAGTVTADYRHDGKNNWTIVNGVKIDSGRRKLGAFIGDNVNTGIYTKIYPGRKLWPNTTTLPGEIVTKDKEE